MKLYAISDLHLGFRVNREALETLTPHPEDWLILGGDVGETLGHLEMALDVATRSFARVLWVPGNHELWTVNGEDARGHAKYDLLVRACRERGVLTPEDPYPLWEGEGGPAILAPLFLLYDYSFRPDEVAFEEAISWAAASGVLCADERYIKPDPHDTIHAWCRERCDEAESRLEEASARGLPLVLINHFPMREELIRLRRIPRFSIWCGTVRTKDWHARFNAKVVVSGHLHMRSTDWVDGVRFEEVSLGYPRHWNTNRSLDAYLREILPGDDD